MTNNKQKKPFMIVCEIWNRGEQGSLHRRFKVDRNSHEGRIKMSKSGKYAHMNDKVFVTYREGVK